MTEAPRSPGQPEPDPTAPTPPPYVPPPETDHNYPPPPGTDHNYPPPPPTGGYSPSGGYPSGPGYPPAGFATNDEKTWALIAHFGGALGAFLGGGAGGWIAPLVAMLTKGTESPTVRAHAVAALNFQLTMTIAAIIGWTIGCLLLFIPGVVVMILAIVFGIIGGMRANEGQLYRYPLTINLVR
jgi:uncharacterized Tic20 family protein